MKRTMNMLVGILLLAAGAGCMAPMMGCMSHGTDAEHGSHATPAPGTAAPTPAANPSVAAESWACPMGHFTGDQSGKCPVCGMALIKALPSSGSVVLPSTTVSR